MIIEIYQTAAAIGGLIGMLAGIKSDLNCQMSDFFTLAIAALLGAAVGSIAAAIIVTPFVLLF